MTVNSALNRITYAGNDVTTAFPFPNKFFDDDDLRVILVVDSTGVEVVQALTTDYTVAGEGVGAGGTVTMITAPATGETLVLVRAEQYTQGLTLVENDPFASALVERQFDILTMLAQQNQDQITRSFRLSEGDVSGASLILPTPVALKTFRWDAAGTALEQTDDPAISAVAAAASAAAASSSESGAATSESNAAASAAASAGIRYTFSSTTAMADPGAGTFRLNNATVSSVTAIAFDATSAEAGNPDVSDYIATWDDSTSGLAGHITLQKSGTPSTFAIFSITGAVVDNTGWLQVAVTHITSSGSWSDGDIGYAQSARTGDAGEAGGLTAANNLSDVASAATSLSNLGGVGPATTDTLTNKTLDANGTGNSISNIDVEDLANGTDGEMITWDASGVPSTVAVGTVGQVLTSGGAGVAPTMQDAGGKILQVVNFQTGAVATGSTTVPLDDTIPQNTEGNEYMTLAITPTNSGSILQIDIVSLHASSVSGNVMTVALFQDSTANALAVATGLVAAVNGSNAVSFRHKMTAGTTSATTFKIRIGGPNAGTTTFNGRVGARTLGGVMASSITITEIAA